MDPPPGDFVFLGSVLLPKDRFSAPEETVGDRRIFGEKAFRLAVGSDRGFDGPLVRLPATTEPCFPDGNNVFAP